MEPTVYVSDEVYFANDTNVSIDDFLLNLNVDSIERPVEGFYESFNNSETMNHWAFEFQNFSSPNFQFMVLFFLSFIFFILLKFSFLQKSYFLMIQVFIQFQFIFNKCQIQSFKHLLDLGFQFPFQVFLSL